MRLWPLALALLWIAAPAAAFDSGDIAPGGQWSLTFDEVNEAGHMYHCHPHPWMEGMVHVGEDTDGKTAVHEVDIVEGNDTDDWGFSKTHLYIEAGDTVVWHNRGEAVHTITEAEGGDHMDDHMDDHDDHVDDHVDGDEDAPGLPVVGLLAVLAIAIATRR